VLVETQSIFMLTLYGSLQFIGTLLAPFSGVVGDRFGRRTSLCAIRGYLALLATMTMSLGFAGLLQPSIVLPIAFLSGLVRPSDLVMRQSLVADTMTAERLMPALSLSRMTQDTARIAGSLIGAGLFAHFGIGMAYVFVASFYALGFLLTLGVAHIPTGQDAIRNEGSALAARWYELRDGMRYARTTPAALALMWLAFLVNLSAFPFSQTLMPYVANDIYKVGATGLGQLVATFATGALAGSVMIAMAGRITARFMLITTGLWYLMIAVFAQLDSMAAGLAALFIMGLVQSFAMVSLSGVLLQSVDERYRARVMGIRMLVVYGMPIGLMIAGPLIERYGYPITADIYVVFGLLCVTLIGWRWKRDLWSGEVL
jgi:MFS family permease